MVRGTEDRILSQGDYLGTSRKKIGPLDPKHVVGISNKIT